MKLRNQKSAFTLLEIIIVIIIIGVLASLALPQLFKTIEYSRASEALASITSIRSSLERYLMEDGSYGVANIDSLDIPNPGNAIGAHFTYTVTGSSGSQAYTIFARRTTLKNGLTNDWIQLTQSSTGIAKTGNGTFNKIK